MKPPLKPFTVEVKRSRSSTSVAKQTSSEPIVLIEAQPASAAVPPSQARQLAEQMFASLTSSSSVAPERTLTAQSVFGAVGPAVAPVEKPDVEPAAERVFRAIVPPSAPVHESAPNPSVTKTLSLKGAVPARLREPREGKVPTSQVAESVFRSIAQPAATLEVPDAEPAQKPSATQLASVEKTIPAQSPKPRQEKVPTSRVPASKVVKAKGAAVGKLAAPGAPTRPQHNLPGKAPEVKPAEGKLAQAGPASPAVEPQSQGRQNWGWSPGERWKKRLRHLR